MVTSCVSRGNGRVYGREREGLVILDICVERLVSMNSILEGFRESRFEVIQDDMCEIVS